MKRIDGREVQIGLERDSTRDMVVRSLIGLGLWIVFLYLLASSMDP